MLVSVIIPTYNRGLFIERSLQSVLSQSYRDLEAIVIDDGSTDDTRDRIMKFQLKDDRVQFIRNDRNCGAQAARNAGLYAARGECIAFLDSDNEWLPDKLDKQMALLVTKPDSSPVVYCGYRNISADGEPGDEFKPRHRGSLYKQSLTEWLTDTSTIVARKECLLLINGFDVAIPAFQEWDLCIRMAKSHSFDYVPECLTLYHQHNHPSISKDRLKEAYGYLSILQKFHFDMLRECGNKIMSEHYLKAGRLFASAKRYDLARSCFIKAMRYNPIKRKAMIHLGALLLGSRTYNNLRSYATSNEHESCRFRDT